jgi:uncharacterized protein (DUF58 family)
MPFVPSRLALRWVAALLPFAVVGAALGPPLSVALPMAGGALLLGAVLWSGRSGPRPGELSVQRVLPRRFEVGQPAEVGIEVSNEGRRVWHVRLVDGCPGSLRPEAPVLDVVLPPGSAATLRYGVRPGVRGSFAFVDPLLRIRTARGLAEHLRTLPVPGEARVLPDLRGLAAHRLRARRDLMHLGGARRTRVLGRDGDFDRLRDFVAGDDVRHVDWKATARLRRPITRVWQAEKSQTLVVLVDGTRLMATRAGALTKLDHAIAAALTLAWAGLAAGDRVAVGVFDDRMRTWLAPAAGTARFGALLQGLFDQQPTERFPSYQEAARAVLARVPRRALVVWITDLLDADQGDELVAALARLRRRHLSLVVALDDPAVQALASSEPTDVSGLFVRVGAAEVLEERAGLLRRLQGAGAQIVSEPADRLEPELVDRYLGIKLRGLV